MSEIPGTPFFVTDEDLIGLIGDIQRSTTFTPTERDEALAAVRAEQERRRA